MQRIIRSTCSFPGVAAPPYVIEVFDIQRNGRDATGCRVRRASENNDGEIVGVVDLPAGAEKQKISALQGNGVRLVAQLVQRDKLTGHAYAQNFNYAKWAHENGVK